MSNTNDPINNLHPDILAGILPPDQQDISHSDEPWWLEESGADDEQMYPRDTELSGDMDPESW